MATVLTPTKRTATLKLNNGTDSQGNVKTVTLSIGALNVASWNSDKAMAIMTALSPCLAKTIYQRLTSEESMMTPGA